MGTHIKSKRFQEAKKEGERRLAKKEAKKARMKQMFAKKKAEAELGEAHKKSPKEDAPGTPKAMARAKRNAGRQSAQVKRNTVRLAVSSVCSWYIPFGAKRDGKYTIKVV